MPHLLLATDADWLAHEIGSALGTPDMSIVWVRSGAQVRPTAEASMPDLVVLDMQIGNMGGIAACMDLRHESHAGRLPRLPVLILLDRAPDVFLARSADADAWLVKPINSLVLRRTANELLSTAVAARGEQR